MSQLDQSILHDWQDFIAAEIKGQLDNKITFEQAGEVARLAMQRFQQAWGGIQIYVPKGISDEHRQRNEEIVAKFRAGMHPNALAIQYGVTHRRIFGILADAENEWVKERQIQLFEGADTI